MGPPEPEQKSTTFHSLLFSCWAFGLGLELELSSARKTSRITAEASSAGDCVWRRGMRVVQCFVRVFWAHCLTRKGTLLFAFRLGSEL